MHRNPLGNLTNNSRMSMGPARTRATKPSNESRRQTMAGPNNNNAGGYGMRRQSNFGGARLSSRGSGRMSSVGGRASSGRESSVRRSSMFVQGKSKQDPRPVRDREFKLQCMQNIISYLTMHGYDRPISLASLKAPHTKDVVNMITFLLQTIDPNWVIENHQVDIPQAFKMLGYPLQMSKSSMQTIGSQHSWPALLAAIAWLVELIEYDEEAQCHDEDGGSFDVANVPEKVFFKYLGAAYQDFLEGDDEQAEVEERFEQEFANRDTQTTAEIEKIERENAELLEEIERLEAEPNRVEALSREQHALQVDLPKFQGLVAELENYRATLQRKVTDHEDELEAKRLELSELHEQRAELEATIATQEHNSLDVEKINKEREFLETSLESANAQRDQKEQLVGQQEMNISRCLETVESIIQQFNAGAVKMKLIPSNAKNANGVNFQLDFVPHGSTPNEVLAADLKGKLRPALVALKESFNRKFHKSQEDQITSQSKFDKADEALQEQLEVVRRLQSQLEQMEEEYKSEKNNMSEQLKQLALEASRVQQETQHLRESTASDLSQSQSELENIKRQCAQNDQQQASERSEFNAQLLGLMEQLMNHRAYIQENLTAIAEFFDESKRNLLEEAPTSTASSTTATSSESEMSSGGEAPVEEATPLTADGGAIEPEEVVDVIESLVAATTPPNSNDETPATTDVIASVEASAA